MQNDIDKIKSELIILHNANPYFCPKLDESYFLNGFKFDFKNGLIVYRVNTEHRNYPIVNRYIKAFSTKGVVKTTETLNINFYKSKKRSHEMAIRASTNPKKIRYFIGRILKLNAIINKIKN